MFALEYFSRNKTEPFVTLISMYYAHAGLYYIYIPLIELIIDGNQRPVLACYHLYAFLSRQQNLIIDFYFMRNLR